MASDLIRPELEALKKMVTNGKSENSKIAYNHALDSFLTWYQDQGRPVLSKAVFDAYKELLIKREFSPATVNLHLSAVRALAREAVDNGLLDPALGNPVIHAKGVRTAGVRSGNWLTEKQAQALIQAPDIRTLKGLRDRAILAVMIGGGLRRSEVAALNFGHVQQRDGRWVIVDLIGKGNRTRTVPIPSWSKQAIDEWTQAGNFTDGRIFRSINRGDNITGGDISNQAIADVVKQYGQLCGFSIAAHDLRRTFAKLAKARGAELDQIQLTLGHASIQTTERYLGTRQDLTSAPCDLLKIHLE